MANAKKKMTPNVHKYVNNYNPLKHCSLKSKILKPLWRAAFYQLNYNQLFLVTYSMTQQFHERGGGNSLPKRNTPKVLKIRIYAQKRLLWDYSKQLTQQSTSRNEGNVSGQDSGAAWRGACVRSGDLGGETPDLAKLGGDYADACACQTPHHSTLRIFFL